MSNIEELKELYKNGTSLTQLQEISGICRKKLSKTFKESGVNIILNGQKYTYNESIFETIDTEEKAYWLGFLYADGYIFSSGKRHICELCLSSVDKHHIEKFKLFMECNTPIADKVIKLNDKEYTANRLTIANKKIVNDLISNGCTPKKSLTITFPNLRSNLVRHFIRGFVDGDGHIGIHDEKFIFHLSCGSEDFLNSIKSIFILNIDGYTDTKLKSDSRSKVLALQKGGKKSVLNVMDFLYKDSTIFLDRKYSVYESMKSFAV